MVGSSLVHAPVQGPNMAAESKFEKDLSELMLFIESINLDSEKLDALNLESINGKSNEVADESAEWAVLFPQFFPRSVEIQHQNSPDLKLKTAESVHYAAPPSLKAEAVLGSDSKKGHVSNNDENSDRGSVDDNCHLEKAISSRVLQKVRQQRREIAVAKNNAMKHADQGQGVWRAFTGQGSGKGLMEGEDCLASKTTSSEFAKEDDDVQSLNQDVAPKSKPGLFGAKIKFEIKSPKKKGGVKLGKGSGKAGCRAGSPGLSASPLPAAAEISGIVSGSLGTHEAILPEQELSRGDAGMPAGRDAQMKLLVEMLAANPELVDKLTQMRPTEMGKLLTAMQMPDLIFDAQSNSSTTTTDSDSLGLASSERGNRHEPGQVSAPGSPTSSSIADNWTPSPPLSHAAPLSLHPSEPGPPAGSEPAGSHQLADGGLSAPTEQEVVPTEGHPGPEPLSKSHRGDRRPQWDSAQPPSQGQGGRGPRLGYSRAASGSLPHGSFHGGSAGSKHGGSSDHGFYSQGSMSGSNGYSEGGQSTYYSLGARIGSYGLGVNTGSYSHCQGVDNDPGYGVGVPATTSGYGHGIANGASYASNQYSASYNLGSDVGPACGSSRSGNHGRMDSSSYGWEKFSIGLSPRPDSSVCSLGTNMGGYTQAPSTGSGGCRGYGPGANPSGFGHETPTPSSYYTTEGVSRGYSAGPLVETSNLYCPIERLSVPLSSYTGRSDGAAGNQYPMLHVPPHGSGDLYGSGYSLALGSPKLTERTCAAAAMDSCSSSRNHVWHLIVDTNVLMGVEQMKAMESIKVWGEMNGFGTGGAMKGDRFGALPGKECVVVIIPQAVPLELDGLKKNEAKQQAAQRALK